MGEIFTNIAGNASLCARLAEKIKSRTLPHAHIIEGEVGSGRRTIATNAAAALCCEDSGDGIFPCGVCPACRKIFANKTPDVIRIAPGKDRVSIGVEQSRGIQHGIITVPNDFAYKIYIIEDADKMTPQAQNALLLTLESPPKYAFFFLICRTASAMLETVRSRAPVLRTEPLDDMALSNFIITNNEKAAALSTSAPDAFREVVMAARGYIGSAYALLDEKERQTLTLQKKLAADFIGAMQKNTPTRERLRLIADFSPKRDMVNRQLLTACDALRDLIVIKKAPGAPLCFWLDRGDARQLCGRFELYELLALYKRTENAISLLERNANLRLTLVNLILAKDTDTETKYQN